MENDYSSDDEEHLPGGMQSDLSESEATSEGTEDEDEELSEVEENGDEMIDEDVDKVDESGGEEGDVEGDAGEEGDKDMREDSPEKPRKKTLKRRKSKVKGDSAQPKAKKKRKGKEPLIKKRRSSKPKHLRRDIKTLMKESELDEQTLAAQREEEERRKRLEEQRAQNATPPGLLTQLLETKTSDLIAEQKRNIAESNEYILLESSSGEEDKKQLSTSNQKPKPDVIEILSSDEDVKVLSEGEKDEQSDLEYATPGQEEESGTHTDDSKNCPDAHGRVLVNVNHPIDEQDIFLPQHLAEKVKPHQIGGIRFLYDNLVESLKRFANSAGFGCVLAHSMGLGKTLQVISFTDIVLRYTTARRVLCIVPINTLQNWIAEYDMWLPREGDPATGREGRQFGLFVLNDTHKTTVARAKVIGEWYKTGGVMLMGYEIYRLLCNRRFTGKPKRRKKKTTATDPEVIDLEEEEKIEKGLSNIRSAICDPGPDLVVCDEGHRIKNSLAGISKALKNIKTRRRVVLTGYPLQNNLMEYWCMVDFVRPSYLGTKHEFSNLFERPIQNGQCIDSTPADIRLMRYRAHVLHNKLEGFVQRRGFQVLKKSLPEKNEHVILVRLTQFQKGLYCKFMQCFKDAGAGGWCSTNPLKAFAVGCKIWNHPDILYEVLQQRETDVDTDLDIPELSSKTGLKKQAPNSLGTTTASGAGTSAADVIPKSNGISSFEEKLENMSYQEKVNQILSFEWARENMRNYSQRKLSNGGKMVLLFHIIDESVKHGDKILVFSQSLMTLTLIEKFLSIRKIPDPPDKPEDMCQDWIRNVTYFRLDGSTAGTERERMINQFNKPDNQASWLFLLSTRAGCLGVNLIGANRVVVLDASWNPCHDAQAVCRVYRYGQKRTCHIYRMVTDNTLEKKIYDRQISKKGMSDRVVDELNPQMNLTKREVESLLEFDDSDMPFEDFSHLADNYNDPILRSICVDHSQTICKAPFSTESLLWDRKDQRLTRAEKAQARKSYEDELRLNTSYNRPSYAAYYPKSDKYSSGASVVPSVSGSYDTSLPYLLNMRGQIEMPKKPIASVRPLQSTPVPKYPPNTGIGLNKLPTPGLGAFNNLKGLSVQKLVATTDIILPGINSVTNTTAKINAGDTVTFIKTQRGIYLRTPEGRFIAVRGPSNKDSNQQSVPRSLSQDMINLDPNRDSPRSVSSEHLMRTSVAQSTRTQTSLTQAGVGPTCSIPQMSSASLNNSTAMNLMNSIASSTETVNQSAISTSNNPSPMIQTSIPQGMPPFMYNQQFPVMTTGSTFYPQQLPINFSLSNMPPSTSFMTTTSSVGTNELSDLFLPQSSGLSLGNAVQQQNCLPQGGVLPSQGSTLTQGAALPQASGIGGDVTFCSPPLTHQKSSESSSPQPSVKFTSEPLVHQQDVEAPFLGGSPQLPTLDASSVEEILNGTSGSKQSAGDVQSSNLASLSQFVSSSFPTS